MREVEIVLPCHLSAEEFWSLRLDTGFDGWFAEKDKQIFTLDKNEHYVNAEGVECINRAFRLATQENQVPKALRAMMPSANKFFVKMTAQFCPNLFDEEHPYAYTAKYPVFTERIKVSGIQWVEPVSPTACRLHARIKLHIGLAVVGGVFERWVENLMRKAYDELPDRRKPTVQSERNNRSGKTVIGQ